MKSKRPGRPLLVTTSWDDGHPSDLRVADLLERHGISGTFYVPCTNSEGRPVMRPKEVAHIARRFEIGGHTQAHVSLTAIAPQVAEGQIQANKRRLEDLIGHEVHGFAYVRGHHNPVVRDLVKRAGFKYARTVKNFMSTPGVDRFEVPTTAQFFAHQASTYLRNYISGGPTLQRSGVLRAVLGSPELGDRLLKAAVACLQSGGYFHLWGHSWELDEHDLWDELDRFLGRLRQSPAVFVTNDEWCASLYRHRELDGSPIPVCTRCLDDYNRTVSGRCLQWVCAGKRSLSRSCTQPISCSLC
jgi:peptidoglycan/xylan/chitin deacetylase (PgdA/CDA1 family)